MRVIDLKNYQKKTGGYQKWQKKNNTGSKSNIFKGVILTLLIAILALVILKPVLSPHHIDFYTYIAIVLLASSKLILSKSNKKISKILSGFCILFLITGSTIINTFTSPLFFANKYQNLLGEVKEGDFKKDLEVEELKDIRLVDQEMALALATKKLGEVPAIGSVSKVGNIKIQTINGELFWVAPLLHKDSLKAFLNFDKGTTGYVMVSATNPQVSKLVQKIDGEDVKIKYQPEGFLTRDLDTYTYFIGKKINCAFGSWSFELNDDGRPYWVAPTYKNTLPGNSNTAQITGVLTLDASTGELKQYSIKDTPKWIDRIQPESVIKRQIDYWGKYVNGFLNSVTTEENVLVSTDGMSLIFGKDGKAYWYTGLTSSGRDDSTVGFILINSRTKEATLYKQPGGTEIAAMQSAQNKVSNFNGYRSSFPIMYNIFGKPTYVSAIKDSSGLLKKVAFVSAEDVSIVSVGDTKEEAYRNYKKALSKSGSELETDTSDTQTIKGKINRLNTIIKDNSTYIYFTLDNSEHIFKSCLDEAGIYLAKKGDPVKVKIEKDAQEKEVEVIGFENSKLK